MTTTIIDALMVTLGLDTTGFTKGKRSAESDLKKIREASGLTSQEVEAGAKKMADGYAKARNELLGFVTAAITTSGFARIMETANTALNNKMGQTAYYFGESVREIDAWGKAVTTAGGTAAAFQGSWQNILGGLTAFSLGKESDVVKGLNALGIDVLDPLTGKVKEMKAIMLDLAKAFSNPNMAPQTKLFAANMIGIDQGTLNFLRDGAGNAQAAYEKFYALNTGMDANADAAKKLTKLWADFNAELDTMGSHIYQAVNPALASSLELVNKLGAEFLKFDESIGGKGSAALAGGLALGGTAAGAFLFKSLFGQGAAAGASAAGGAAGAAAGAAAVPAAAESLIWSAETGGYVVEGAAAGGTMATAIEAALLPLKKVFAEFATAAELHGVDVMKTMGLARTALRGGIFSELLLHSEGLNEGEDAELAKRRAAGVTETQGAKTGGGNSSTSAALFARLETEQKLPPGMLDRIWSIESARGKKMMGPVTSNGERAEGHFQFMPETAKQYGLKGGDAYDLEKSATAAARFLSDLMRRYGGNVDKTLAAYNWGPANVDRNGLNHLPDETSGYLGKYHSIEGAERMLGQLASILSQSTSPIGGAIGDGKQFGQQLTQQQILRIVSGSVPTGNTTSTAVTINGGVHVDTLATDAYGIAASMEDALQKKMTMAGAATGMK